MFSLFANHPAFLTMLLLIAGILVGYAVCYPFRADTSGVSEQLKQVQQQNGSLQQALDEQRHAYARLEQKNQEQQYEWAQVRDSQLDLTTAWNKFGQNYSQVSAELKQLQKSSDESNEMVKHERAERRVVEEALLAAEDKVDSLQQRLAQQDQDASSNNKLQARLDEAHQQIERLTSQVGAQQNSVSAEVSALSGRFAEATEALQLQRGESQKLQEALDSQTRELKVAQEEISKLRSAGVERSNLVDTVSARRKQVQKLEAERDEARAGEHKIRRELERYKSATLDRDRELDRLRNQSNRFELESKEVAKLREQNSQLEQAALETQELKNQLAQLGSERDAAVAAQQVARTTMEKIEKQNRENRQLKQRCDEAVASLHLEQETHDSLKDKLEESELENRQLREQYEQVIVNLQREQQSRNSLETKLDGNEEELSSLRQRCRKLQDAGEECAKLRSALDDDRRRLQQVTIERDAAFAAELAAKDELTRQEHESPDPKEIERVRHQREEVLNELETVRNDRERLQRTITRQEEQITSLQAHVCRLEATSTSDVTLAGRLSQQAERLRKVSLEHELNSASLGQAEQTINELRQLLSSREATIEGLQRDRESSQRVSASSGARLAPNGTRTDPRLGLVYLRRPSTCDDLKQISGIGEELERKLNDFGVYTFTQIMQWDRMAIAEFSKLLSFRDRVERENWVGQARRIYNTTQERAA